ncbi:fimbrial biogenesis outer membrane usher protein [Dyella solisilvae]|uniref:Fimbrial biogenesis outer membrane usher protein n=1 Tax=Dyella solisilvae TaxID=1920168 RepID=A0A370K730_9GAMM|nr:fimbria/pilus outer membrane usher protein [Dyella solisilvae]RDI98434.1 fimbrial biogenesis outer membrane usher protein [Dyella solisilvae]
MNAIRDKQARAYQVGVRRSSLPRVHALARFVMVALGTAPVAVRAASSLVGPALEPASGAAVVEFSTAFTGASQTIDVSRFERGNPVLPGHYNVDIFVNDGRVARKDIEFRATQNSNDAYPCFDYATLLQMGVETGRLDPGVVNAQSACITINQISPDAMVRMDVGDLRLDVSIPQEAMLRHARGYVSQDLWDHGESAFLMGYSFNAYSLDQSYGGVRLTNGGSAIAYDGSRVQVQGAQYYLAGPGGSYVADSMGNYMLTADGRYVPVQRGTFVSAPSGGYSSHDISAFLGLNLGMNVKGWRLRSQETGQWDQRAARTRWTNINTTATHDITLWKAQLTIGDGYTQGIVFDTTPFRGITMYSDDRMLPDSQQGYAPVVRGTANTQARVEVRQNGNLLYQATVAPGSFVIDDLYATGYGGDLTVTVFEADGSVRSFLVPYSAVPMLLRPGIGRWSITDGQVHNTALRHDKPYFVEGTYQRGINNWMTLYGGVQSTYLNLYHAYLGGAAVNTPVGAFALDVTRSRTSFQGTESLSGYSTRFSYSKAIQSSGTTFALASYRYSNGNFLSLADAVVTQDMLESQQAGRLDTVHMMRARERLNVTVSQNFGNRYGQLYFNGSRNSYWNGMPSATTYQLGYSNSYRRVNFGITAGRTYTTGPMYNGSHYDSQFGINLSVPLGGPSSRRAPMLQFSATYDDALGNNDRVGVTGTFGKDSQFNYGANASYTDQSGAGSRSTASGTLSWQGPRTNLNAGYSYSGHYQQASISASGGLVAHPGGLTLSPQLDLNGAIGVVEARDAKGARVSSSGQAKVDARGYAIAANLTPYRLNDVTLDPTGTSNDVELQTTRLQTAPRAGAVVPLKFETSSGRAVLIRVSRVDGEGVPFGAQVLDPEGREIGAVGQGGQLFVRGGERGGELTVRWGDEEARQCRVNYQLPERDKGEKSLTVESMDAVCR